MSENAEFRSFPQFSLVDRSPNDRVRRVTPDKAELIELAAHAAYASNNAEARALRDLLAKRYAIFGPRAAQIYGTLD